MYTVYGYRLAPENDRFVKLAEESFSVLDKILSPSAIDFFPFLLRMPSWFPGAGIKRLAEECRSVTEEMLVGHFHPSSLAPNYSQCKRRVCHSILSRTTWLVDDMHRTEFNNRPLTLSTVFRIGSAIYSLRIVGVPSG